MEELIEILDAEGNKTGEVEPRSVVHTQGLWHKTVHIYLYRMVDSKVELLVHLRSKIKDLSPNMWDRCFGGHLKVGDSVESAVKSELQEEIGLQIEPEKLKVGRVYKREVFPNNEFMAVYYYELYSGLSELTFNDGEVQEVKWMKVGDIRNSMKDAPELWAGTEADLAEIDDLL